MHVQQLTSGPLGMMELHNFQVQSSPVGHQ